MPVFTFAPETLKNWQLCFSGLLTMTHAEDGSAMRVVASILRLHSVEWQVEDLASIVRTVAGRQ